MSKKIYSVFEYVEPHEGTWKVANLYQKYDGSYGIAQLIRGDSETYAALFGEEDFDFIYDDNGEMIDDLVDPIKRIGKIISESNSSYLPPNASKETDQFYKKFIMGYQGVLPTQEKYLECEIYTLLALELIEMLARSASSSALRFYNKHFAQVRWLLETVKHMQYVLSGADVRVIMWGC